MNSTVSVPPLNSDKPQRPVTFADVAMKMAQDGPVYAVLAVALILAMRGTATASEAIYAGLAGLLARMWPQAVQVAGKVGAHMLVFAAAGAAFLTVHACASPAVEGGQYGTRLTDCNQEAKDLCQSIRCENMHREVAGRSLRTVPPHCLDGGTEGGTL